MSRNYVKKYVDLGFNVTPVKYQTKKPFLPSWPTRKLSQDELSTHFHDDAPINIGVVLGAMSNGLVDVDIDDPRALLFAKLLLPRTDMIFGRDSNPESHHIYKVSDPRAGLKLSDPLSDECIIELRSNGAQTVFPGSTHVSGEFIRFEDGKDGIPSISDVKTLEQRVAYVAVSTILFEYWHRSKRHKLSLAFSGLCAANGIAQADCEEIVQALCDISNDEEANDRLACVSDSYNKHALSQKITGIKNLVIILGEKVAITISKWMGVPQQNPKLIDSHVLTRLPCELSNDLSAAQHFSEAVRDTLLFSEKDGRFYRRVTDVYEPIGPEQAMHLAMQFVDGLTSGPNSWQDQQLFKSIRSHARMNAMLNLSKSHLCVAADKLDSDPYVVGCHNGVLDLRVRKLVLPEIVVTKRLGTAFNEEATCPRFEAFLAQIMKGDAELISFVKRAVGYSLTGLVTAQCMFLGIGTGANGKSTFQKIIQDLLGDYACATPMSTLMVSKYGNDKTDDLANLQGRRFVCAQEGESNQSLAVAKIKMMTGGDRISCRFLYQSLFDYDPQFKLWVFTNELPRVPGGDEALWRRIHIVPFSVTIPPSERDPDLARLLKEELPGILNWALDGFAEFQALGERLTPPSSILNATSGYRNESDVVRQFVDACCEQTSAVTRTEDSRIR